MLTEIASTMLYALLLYRAKVTPTRVMLSRHSSSLGDEVMDRG
jgi:hypothetical protein